MNPSARVPVVIFMTSNGAGMGHLARQAAVAASAAGGFAPVLLSLSTALPVVAAASGLRAEYCPGPARQWMRTDVWHRYLERRLVALVGEVGASALVFDGTSPYPGLLAARRSLPDLQLVWSRRGMWRADASRAPLRAARYFDLVLEPGDLAEPADAGPTAALGDARRVGPVTLLETEPLQDRAEARAALGLDPDRPLLLVTLGAGRINDPSAALGAAVRTALAADGWQVAVTRAPLALRELSAELRERVTVLDGVYPLVRHLAAFDAAVSAAGYNAVHELVLGGLPTLLVPNAATSTDDQVTRARYVAERGWALVAAEDDPESVVAAVRQLLDEGARRRLRTSVGGLARPDGASAFAAAVADLVAHPVPRALDRDPYRSLRTASALIRRGVGEAAWERARRWSGAPPRTLEGEPAAVLESAGPLPPRVRRLLVTHDLAALADDPDAVVEHLLGGSSPAYEKERRAIAGDSYKAAAT